MQYEFHPEAEWEFIEQATYYQSEIPGLGDRFAGEVERVVELLLEYPESGGSIDPHLRHFVLRRFPHSIIYSVIGETLVSDWITSQLVRHDLPGLTAMAS